MNLIFREVVKMEAKKSPMDDERRKMNVAIVSYIGEDGLEYRKSFESYGIPTIPQSGENIELSKMKKQW